MVQKKLRLAVLGLTLTSALMQSSALTLANQVAEDKPSKRPVNRSGRKKKHWER